MYQDHPIATGRGVNIVNIALNLVWLVLGGAAAAFGWFIAGLIMIITIIGIPFARAAFDNGMYTLWPFGARVADRGRLYGENRGAGPLGFLGNVIWLILAGWWLAIGHWIAALCFAVTIIGLPFAWAHLKLGAYALWPIGRSVVDPRTARMA